MNKILRKAILRHCNEFFAMTPEEQDAFKLEEHDELDEKISQFVHEALDYGEDENNPEKQFEYNKIMLEWRGIGENNFMLNEFDWGKDILRHETLYDYNVWYHEWQEEAFRNDENFPNYTPTELYNRFSAWARAEVNGKFHYLNLLSLQQWLHWKLEEFGNKWIDKEIPHEYVSGSNDGKKTDGGYLWDMRLDANGLEGWYEQINDFFREWLNKKYEEVTYLNDVVYILDTSHGEFDPCIDYVFGSMGVLKELTFKNFINDAQNVCGDGDELMKLKDTLIEELRVALENELIEIKKTPPNVMKLKKKMKVVMSDQALEDLENLED